MITIRDALATGLILRPLQMIVVGYLAIIQWQELQSVTKYQRIKKLLFSLFAVNFVVYGFSLFIDIVGFYRLFLRSGLNLLIAYLFVNVLSATLITATLLVIYKARINE